MQTAWRSNFQQWFRWIKIRRSQRGTWSFDACYRDWSNSSLYHCKLSTCFKISVDEGIITNLLRVRVSCNKCQRAKNVLVVFIIKLWEKGIKLWKYNSGNLISYDDFRLVKPKELLKQKWAFLKILEKRDGFLCLVMKAVLIRHIGSPCLIHQVGDDEGIIVKLWRKVRELRKIINRISHWLYSNKFCFYLLDYVFERIWLVIRESSKGLVASSCKVAYPGKVTNLFSDS